MLKYWAVADDKVEECHWGGGAERCALSTPQDSSLEQGIELSASVPTLRNCNRWRFSIAIVKPLEYPQKRTAFWLRDDNRSSKIANATDYPSQPEIAMWHCQAPSPTLRGSWVCDGNRKSQQRIRDLSAPRHRWISEPQCGGTNCFSPRHRRSVHTCAHTHTEMVRS